MAVYEAVWTGRFPNLCSGKWELRRDGETLDIPIPFNGGGEGHDSRPAYTLGVHSSWHFGPDWDEVWETCEDGADCATWCQLHRHWLRTFAPEEDWPAVFDAFQASDWRHGECGGCI